MVTEAEIKAAVPQFTRPGRNWSGLCEAAIWNLFDVLGTGGPSSASATVARKRSKLEGDGWGPGDNVVWWSGVWGYENGKQVDFGHVAYHLGGGWAFMASSQVTTVVGPYINIGFVDLNRYEKRFPNMKLEGWSYDHAGATITRAGGANTVQQDEGDDVSFAEQIDWRGGKVSAAALIVATAINAELAVAKVDALAAKLDAADYTRHNGVDAPNDVVDADTLKVVQQTEAKVEQLVKLLAETDVPSATA